MTTTPPAPTVLDLIELLARPTPDEQRSARVQGARAKLRGHGLPEPTAPLISANPNPDNKETTNR